MKTFCLSLALCLSAIALFAQVATNDAPALTNNVQYVWSTDQATLLKSLWRDDYAALLADYQARTNAMPGYATNAPPTLPAFSLWAATLFRETARTNVAAWTQARQAAAAAQARQRYEQMLQLWVAAFPLLTPAQQLAQSNTLRSAIGN
jgi:hypothetical protein